METADTAPTHQPCAPVALRWLTLRLVIRKSPVSLLTLLCLIEIVGLFVLIVGPRRFELALRDLGAAAAFRVLDASLELSPTGSDAAGSGPAPLREALRLAHAGNPAAAQSWFASRVELTTWIGGEPQRATLSAGQVKDWLTYASPSLTFERERLDNASGETVETLRVSAGNLQWSGLASYKLIYQARSRNGQIVALTLYYDPAAVGVVRSALPSLAARGSPAFVGDALALVGLFLPVGPGIWLLVRRPRRTRLGLAVVAVPLLAGLVTFGVSLASPDWNDVGLVVPGHDLYRAHAALGSIVEDVDGPDRFGAIQWTKAASHAENAAEVSRTAAGIARARRQSADPASLDVLLCDLTKHGSPTVRDAVTQAGVGCPW
jgi:hypothetical protein